jgi:hypothetical protein
MRLSNLSFLSNNRKRAREESIQAFREHENAILANETEEYTNDLKRVSSNTKSQKNKTIKADLMFISFLSFPTLLTLIFRPI